MDGVSFLLLLRCLGFQGVSRELKRRGELTHIRLLQMLREPPCPWSPPSLRKTA